MKTYFKVRTFEIILAVNLELINVWTISIPIPKNVIYEFFTLMNFKWFCVCVCVNTFFQYLRSSMFAEVMFINYMYPIY